MSGKGAREKRRAIRKKAATITSTTFADADSKTSPLPRNPLSLFFKYPLTAFTLVVGSAVQLVRAANPGNSTSTVTIPAVPNPEPKFGTTVAAPQNSSERYNQYLASIFQPKLERRFSPPETKLPVFADAQIKWDQKITEKLNTHGSNYFFHMEKEKIDKIKENTKNIILAAMRVSDSDQKNIEYVLSNPEFYFNTDGDYRADSSLGFGPHGGLGISFPPFSTYHENFAIPIALQNIHTAVVTRLNHIVARGITRPWPNDISRAHWPFSSEAEFTALKTAIDQGFDRATALHKLLTKDDNDEIPKNSAEEKELANHQRFLQTHYTPQMHMLSESYLMIMQHQFRRSEIENARLTKQPLMLTVRYNGVERQVPFYVTDYVYHSENSWGNGEVYGYTVADPNHDQATAFVYDTYMNFDQPILPNYFVPTDDTRHHEVARLDQRVARNGGRVNARYFSEREEHHENRYDNLESIHLQQAQTTSTQLPPAPRM